MPGGGIPFILPSTVFFDGTWRSLVAHKTFEEAAKASKQSPKEAKKKTLELLKIILKKE